MELPHTLPNLGSMVGGSFNREHLKEVKRSISGAVLIVYKYTPTFFGIPEPPQIVPFSFGKEVFDEGEYAQISCIVSSGDLPLKISWSLQGSDSEKAGGGRGITTAPMGSRASFLSIDSVGSMHGGKYTCTARNKAGVASFSTSLGVNGN